MVIGKIDVVVEIVEIDPDNKYHVLEGPGKKGKKRIKMLGTRSLSHLIESQNRRPDPNLLSVVQKVEKTKCFLKFSGVRKIARKCKSFLRGKVKLTTRLI
jgi:hypothetical protein